ncbi:MAG: hypothetical protein V3W20_02220 [Candidatus Neomarinimicrobiota bacterium]
MKTLVIILLIIINICFTQNSEIDSLTAKHKTVGFDKIQHAAFSCLWTLSSQYVMVNKSGFDEHKALSYSVSSSVLIGLAKELNDLDRKNTHFNWGDIIADGIGIVIAVLIITN